jgi:serine protease Do
VTRGGFLGIGIQEITPDRAKALKLRDDAGGVEVTRVGSDTPADKAGMKAGDVVLQYNGIKIDGLEQFSKLVRDTPIGREVRLDIFRNGGSQSLTVKIGPHPGMQLFSRDNGFPPNFPDVPRVFQGSRSPMLGVEVEGIDGQLAQYFGVKEGVLVRSVMKSSAAEKAAFKAGDVILRVDDAAVTTPADLANHVRTSAGKPVSISIIRDHKEMSLTVTPEALPDGISRWDR